MYVYAAFKGIAMKLSILICTLTSRRWFYQRLRGILDPQCHDQPVEILFEEDAGQITIGEKRQKLLERAQGEYVCFIDDDDTVAANYVSLILRGLEDIEVTHCSLRGKLRQAGKVERQFEHSTRYTAWETTPEGLYVRPPNHLNTIRRDLALEAGFVSKSFGEDREFSEKLVALGRLTKEAWIEPVLYIYNYTAKKPPQRVPGRPYIHVKRTFR